MEFPQVYKNADGVELIARNDIQAAVFEREGFVASGKYEEPVEKKGK
jgi:hypothetical protein